MPKLMSPSGRGLVANLMIIKDQRQQGVKSYFSLRDMPAKSCLSPNHVDPSIDGDEPDPFEIEEDGIGRSCVISPFWRDSDCAEPDPVFDHLRSVTG